MMREIFQFCRAHSRPIANTVSISSYSVIMGRRAKYLTAAQQTAAARIHKQTYLATPQ
jgi:hypothetical protein